MRELIVFLLFLSGFSAISNPQGTLHFSARRDAGSKAYRRTRQTTAFKPWSNQGGMMSGAYFSFMASVPSHEARRKSYSALKSQANAMTFIFLSGLILSQSLILASNFTAPEIPGSALAETPTGLALFEGTENSGEIVPPSPPEIAGDAGAAAPDALVLDSGETPVESPPNAPPEEAGTISPPETGSGSTEAPAGSGAEAPPGDGGTGASEPQVVLPVNGTEISAPPVLPEPAQNELPPTPQIDANFTEHGLPVLEMRLNVPENIKRSDAFSLDVKITNTGASGAKNVAVDFTIPEGISFVSGEKSIGEIPAGETIRREFIFQSSYGAAPGASKIKVRMTYE